ncbi:hypothetical protein OS493_035534 [Desmophyllum pertusum]|uniref:CxC2-like cysteine cluster KDZ transposase-associated domain-containing protein n=1 Tax=Desmophyllum pertusum TaxID=174260 RepID=A0A9W9YLJ3_9CNID|nr:hypothetical protein OS493_035534 [Desmophyllum pertusum]
MGRRGKRIRAEINVIYHEADGVKKTKVPLNSVLSDAHGACSSTVDEYSPATGDGVAADDDPAIGESGDDLGDEELSSHHYRRLQRAEDAWSKLREAVISTTLQNQGFLAGKKCCVCSMVANCRCLDCSPTMSLCESCASDQHKVHNIFHHVEILRDGIYFPLKIPRTLIWPDHQCSNGVNFRKLMVVDSRGLQTEVSICFCECEADFLRLLRFQLWGATPTKPELAFTINVMELLHTLNLECQVAVKDFCAAIEAMANKVISFPNLRKLYPVLIDSLEEFRIYQHKLTTLTFVASASSVGDLNNGVICPACPKSQGTLLESMDALFIGRKKTAGKSVRSPLFGNLLFCDDGEVEEFVQHHRQAASKETMGLAYPVWILNDLLDEIPEVSGIAIHMLYDIACLLERHLQVHEQERIIQHVNFAIPIFHCYGHKAYCQIKYSPRRVSGFGLTDGEVLERLWSFLRRFGKMTKEMRPNHRVDVLTDALLYYANKRSASLGKLLSDRMKRANLTIKMVKMS